MMRPIKDRNTLIVIGNPIRKGLRLLIALRLAILIYNIWGATHILQPSGEAAPYVTLAL